MENDRTSDSNQFLNVIAQNRDPNEKLLPNLPRSILEDDYFRRNLPPTYGTISLPPSENDTEDLEDFAFEKELKLCSKGYQELSNNLSAFGHSSVSWTASYKQNLDPVINLSEEDVRKKGGLLTEPGYGQLNENFSAIFQSKETEVGKLPDNLFISTTNTESRNNRNFIFTENENSDTNRVHPYDTASIPGIYDNQGAPKSTTNTMETNAYNTYINKLSESKGELFDPLRYQNVTYDNLGERHAAVSVDVRPYGIARYNFFAQFDNELSLQEGDMVYLKKYVDEEWMEGEVDRKRGLVPIGYVNIIVDCVEVKDQSSTDILQSCNNTEEELVAIRKQSRSSNIILQLDPLEEPKSTVISKVSSKIKPGTYHTVSFTFQAQMDGDLNIVEGEVIRVLEEGNENVHWLNVENSFGERGLCPANHLDPTEEFDGKVLFDIDRLLKYKNEKEHQIVHLNQCETSSEPISSGRNAHASSQTANSRKDLKFFDPLCSPDDDMLLVEAELERKAKEANTLPIQETVARKKQEQLARFGAVLLNVQPDFVPPERKKLRNKEGVATDIDDFISTNISKLGNLKEAGSLRLSLEQNPNGPRRAMPNKSFDHPSNGNQKTNIPIMELSNLHRPEIAYENVKTRQLVKEPRLHKDTANLASSQLDISKSILMELRGSKTRARKPAPPRPQEPPKLLNFENTELLHGATNTKRDTISYVNGSDHPISFNEAQHKSPIPPAKPPPPLRNTISEANQMHANSNNSNPNFNPFNAAESYLTTKESSFDCMGNTDHGNSAMKEPVYAKVNKSLTGIYSLTEALKDQSAAFGRPLLTNDRFPPPPSGKKPPRPPKIQSPISHLPYSNDNDVVKQALSCTTKRKNLDNISESSAQKDVTTLQCVVEKTSTNFSPRYDDVYGTNDDVADDKKLTNIMINGQPMKNSTLDNDKKGYEKFDESEFYATNDGSSSGKGWTNNTLKCTEDTGDSVPRVPQRTSSCSMRKVIDEWHQRNININVNKSLNSATHHSSHQNRREEHNRSSSISRGYMNVKEFTASTNGKPNSPSGITEFNSFPPDKEGPMSPPPSENPPKIQTLPYRCVSVGSSSIKSRSVFYASVPSERGESPSYSSLNHSYETLNMSDNGDTASIVAQTANQTSDENVPRIPSRPAPPVPLPKYKMTAGERKYLGEHLDEHNSQVEYEEWRDSMSKSGSLTNMGCQSKGRSPMSRRTLRHRKIHSVKRQIHIKEKMLEEQLLIELDMYQEIAVAKGAEYDKLNQKMDKVQDNIEKLSDDIQRLQACLADEELKAEEDSIEETKRKEEEQSRRAQLEVQMREEEKRIREERMAKNKERRENVIKELEITERDFCRDLKLTWQAFGLDTPAMLEQRNVDVSSLFGNLSDIIEVSESFLESLQLEAKNKTSVSEENVGSCFLQHADAMKTAYTDYCVNHDKAEQLMEKYEAIPDISRLLQRGVETIQAQVSCFNMGSILIKPVQRILKYPLILNELVKCTEETYSDKEDLSKAVTIMSNIAAFINESKRRKDIVDKYRGEEDKTLTRRMAKFNMHSLNKKSTRMSQRIFSSLGMESKSKDVAFEDHEKRFNDLKESVQAFTNDASRFREYIHDTIISQYNIAQNVSDLYTQKVHAREVERFRSAHKKIMSTYWNEFNTRLQKRVLKPLQSLLETFIGPSRLIQKRQDKCLDYSASQQKAEKNKEPSRSKNLQEEEERCKANYDALNSQLVEELPKFLDIGTNLYVIAIKEFISNRRLFVGRITQELLSLMDVYKTRLPLLASTTGDIIEVFLVKHSMICNQISRFTFSSKTLKNVNEEKANIQKSLIQSSNQKIYSPCRPSYGTLQLHLPSSHTTENNSKSNQASSSATENSNSVIQTANTRMLLRGKYASAKLFQVNQAYNAQEQLEVTAHAGDLVGVIQQKDPMGDGNRWYVDNGVVQGFLPSRVLQAIGDEKIPEKKQTLKNTGSDVLGNKNNPTKNKPPTVDSNGISSKIEKFENISTLNKDDENKCQDQNSCEKTQSSSKLYVPPTCHETQEIAIENSDVDKEVITVEAVVHAYDDVALDETDNQNITELKPQPVRKAPAPPTSKSSKAEYSETSPEQHATSSKRNNEMSTQDKEGDNVIKETNKPDDAVTGQDRQEIQEETYGTTDEIDDEVEKGSAITVNSNSSGNTNSNDYSTNAQVGQDTDIERTGSHHSYEEIPPSEANSEVSNIYIFHR